MSVTTFLRSLTKSNLITVGPNQSLNWKETLFSYHTPMSVVIENKCLALIHYVIAFTILGYVVGYNIIVDKGYLSKTKIINDIRFGLSSPKTRVPTWNLPYCTQYNGSAPAHTQATCKKYAKPDIQYPSAIDDKINIAMFDSLRVCPNCPSKEKYYANQSYFVSNLEDYSIKILHSFYFDGHSGGSRDLFGKLVDPHGNIVQEFTPGGKDKISLQNILTAAQPGLTLDSPSDIPPDDLWTNMLDYANTTFDTSWGDSFRHQGIVLFMQIDYEVANNGSISYVYRPTRLKSNDYSVKLQTQKHEDIELRLGNWSDTFEITSDSQTLHYQGVFRLLFVGGEYKEFAMTQILVHLASSWTLFCISYFILDLMLTRCLRRSKYYRQAKYWSLVNAANQSGAVSENVSEVIRVNNNTTAINAFKRAQRDYSRRSRKIVATASEELPATKSVDNSNLAVPGPQFPMYPQESSQISLPDESSGQILPDPST